MYTSGMAEERKDLAIQLLSQGYTTRAVNFRLQDAGLNPFQESELISMRQQYASEISDLREREEIELRAHGVARRGERIRRLNALVELLEERIFPPSAPLGAAPSTLSHQSVSLAPPGEGAVEVQEDEGGRRTRGIPLKLIAEYRKLIAQVGQEADPLGISAALDRDDPWVLLILDLTKYGSDRQLPSSIRSLLPAGSSSMPTNRGHSLPEPDVSSLQVVSEPERASTQPVSS